MEFSEVVRRRRMVRDFADRPLAPEIVKRVLAHALRAPSAGFAQGWAFLALTQQEDLTRLWPLVPTQLSHSPGIQNAPLAVIPMAHEAAYVKRYSEPDKTWVDRRWPAPYWHIDAGMAALMMLLTAVDEGLGACLFAIMPDELPAFRTEFDVPEEYAPIGVVAIGHRPADLPPQSSRIAQRRRKAEDVIHRGQWGRQLSS